MTNKRIDSWETLRFVFIIGVVLYHTNSFFDGYGTNSLGFIYRYGGCFCNYFFFILSGILMAKSYRNKIASGSLSIGAFLIKRVAKLYPVYLLGEITMIVYNVIHTGWGTITVKHLLTDALFITTGWIDGGVNGPYDGPAWFICVLVCCYVIYYSVCRLTSKSSDGYIISVTVILLLGNYLEHNNFEIPFFYRTSGEGYMNFFTGVLAYTFYERVLKDRKKMSSIIIGGLFIFILLGTLLIGTDTFWGDKITTISLICILLLYLTANVYPVRKILEVKPALMFGEISMEIFLLHMPYLYIYLDVIKHTSLIYARMCFRYIGYLISLLLMCFIVHYVLKVMYFILPHIRKIMKDNE